jgi:hypothetical protein
MEDTRTVPEIVRDSVAKLPEGQEVFIPARSLRACGFSVTEGTPDDRLVQTTAGAVRQRFAEQDEKAKKAEPKQKTPATP